MPRSLSLALAGCGASSSKAAPVQPKPKPSGAQVVLDSVQLTAAEKTARIAINASVSGSVSTTGTITGVIDFATGDSQLSLTLSGPAASVLGGGMVFRTVGGVMYLQVPAALRGMLGGPAGAQWMSMPLPNFGSKDTGGLGAAAGGADPAQMLAGLAAVSNGVTTVGPQTIRGVATTHYHAVIDPQKVAANVKLSPALRKALQKLEQRLGGQSPTIPTDVWVDAAGRVRRLAEQVQLGGAGAVTTTIDFYDFGVPVNVQAPPADQVVPFPSIGDLGGLGGASGASGSAA